MYAEFKAAIESAKALVGIASAAKSVIDQAAIASAMADLNGKLLAVQNVAFEIQEKYSALREEAAELKDTARKAENWAGDAENRELRQVATGVFAFVNKPIVSDFESAVKLCATCHGERKRSILQQELVDFGREYILRCTPCKSALKFTHYLA